MSSDILFDEYELRSCCSNALFRLGKKICSGGKIRQFQHKNGTLKCQCIDLDNKQYGVAFNKTDQGVSTWCMCDKKDVYCEHVVALCLYYLDQISAKKNRRSPHTESDPSDESFFERSLDQIVETVGIKFSISGKSASFCLFDQKTGATFGASFYAVYTIDDLISRVKNEKDKRFLSWAIGKFGSDFFNPGTAISVSDLRHFSLENLPVLYSQSGRKISQSDQPLALNLCGDWQGDIGRLKTRLVGENLQFSLNDGVVLPFSPPLWQIGHRWYPLQHPMLVNLIPQLLVQEVQQINVGKFFAFLKQVVPSLEKKGVRIILDETLKNIQIKRGKPDAVLKLRKWGPYLAIQPQFRYENRLVSFSYSHHYLASEKPGIFIGRDLEYEKSICDKLERYVSLRNGFVTQGDAAYEAVKWINSQPGWEVSYPASGPVFWVEKPIIQPKFKILNVENHHHLMVDVSFFLNKTCETQAIIPQIDKRKRYLAIRSKIYQLGLSEIVYDLLETATVESTDPFLIRVDAGTAADLLKTHPRCWVETDTTEEFLKPLTQHQFTSDSVQYGHLNNILMPYQKAGISWLGFLKKWGIGGLLADEMGLGKTVQTLALLGQIYSGKTTQEPTLIVMPKTLLFNWENEVRRYTPNLNVLIYDGSKRRKWIPVLGQYNVILCSYGVLRRDIDLLKEISFLYVVLDEAQAIKNHRSKTFQVVRQLRARHRIALSGTPIENRVSELWSIFEFLMPGYLPDYATFKSQYEIPIQQGQEHVIEQLKRKVQLFILRRKKETIALELPQKTERIRYCNLSKLQVKLYQHTLAMRRQDLVDKINTLGFKRAQFHVLSLLTTLRQICCHPGLAYPEHLDEESEKFELLKEMVHQIISGQHKVVVFSQFVQMLKIIQKWLVSEKIGHGILTGKVQKRDEVITSFNTDPDISVLLVSLKAGGVGINLTAADYVVHYDPWWNPAVEQQASDRVHRIGQTKPVFIYKMIAKATVEDKVMTIQNKKQEIASEFLQATLSAGNEIDPKKLEQLLSYA